MEHYALCEAISIQWAVFRLSAVALLDVLLWLGVQDFGVVVLDNGPYVIHATVAAFDVASVKQLVVSMVFGEMLIQEPQKLSCNVGGNIHVEWWIEP